MPVNNSPRLIWTTGIVILIGLLLYRVLLIFSYNGEIGGIDNNFVYDVIRGIAGYDIYSNPAAPPYAITLYSPLYLTICTAIGKLVHINPDDPIQVYQLCRTISLIFDIISCFLLYRILKQPGTGKELSWLYVACFGCILCILGYTFSRSDSLLLSFYSATMYTLARPWRNKILQAALLALFSAGCILSKQNGLIVPVLVTFWLLITKAGKQTLYYIAFYIAITGTALLVYSSAYPYLFSNTVTALQNRIDLSWFYTDIFKRMMNSLWMLPLYIALILAVHNLVRPATTTAKALAVVFIIQTLFSLGTSLKWGSTAGYFNESFLLAFIIIGQSSLTRKTIIFSLPLLLLFFIHTVTEGYLFFLQNREKKKAVYEQQKQVRDYLQPKLQGHYVLNLAHPNSDFFKTLFYKEIAVPNMDIVDCCTLPDGTFNYSFLKDDLVNGNIRYILYNYDEKPPEIWGVSLEGFTKETAMNGYVIYRFP
jgi:hypothetical protein